MVVVRVGRVIMKMVLIWIEKIYMRSIELVLVLLLNSYLLLKSISVSTSRLFSCPISHYLLTTFKLLTIVLMKDINDFGLRRLFYSKQDL